MDSGTPQKQPVTAKKGSSEMDWIFYPRGGLWTHPDDCFMPPRPFAHNLIHSLHKITY
jgi:hypothetical protein